MNSMSTSQLALPCAEKMEQFCRRWRVTELALFGSALGERFSEKSDVDLLVTFAPHADWSVVDHVKMQRELSEMIGRPVDLVSRRAIQHSQNWIRRDQILMTARTIYAAA